MTKSNDSFSALQKTNTRRCFICPDQLQSFGMGYFRPSGDYGTVDGDGGK
jgi:hypothetical protein